MKKFLFSSYLLCSLFMNSLSVHAAFPELQPPADYTDVEAPPADAGPVDAGEAPALGPGLGPAPVRGDLIPSRRGLGEMGREPIGTEMTVGVHRPGVGLVNELGRPLAKKFRERIKEIQNTELARFQRAKQAKANTARIKLAGMASAAAGLLGTSLYLWSDPALCLYVGEVCQDTTREVVRKFVEGGIPLVPVVFGFGKVLCEGSPFGGCCTRADDFLDDLVGGRFLRDFPDFLDELMAPDESRKPIEELMEHEAFVKVWSLIKNKIKEEHLRINPMKGARGRNKFLRLVVRKRKRGDENPFMEAVELMKPEMKDPEARENFLKPAVLKALWEIAEDNYGEYLDADDEKAENPAAKEDAYKRNLNLLGYDHMARAVMGYLKAKNRFIRPQFSSPVDSSDDESDGGYESGEEGDIDDTESDRPVAAFGVAAGASAAASAELGGRRSTRMRATGAGLRQPPSLIPPPSRGRISGTWISDPESWVD